MVYSTKSTLTKSDGHYTADQLWAAFKPMTPPDQYANAQRVFKALVPLCVAFSLDEIALAAIIWIETGAANTGLPFRSEWFVKYFNLGNIGITGDPAQNAAAQKWTTPEDGVLGLVAHAVAYAYGSKWATVWNVDDYGKHQIADTRFALVLKEYGGKALNSLEALNGRWAWDVDNNYDGKLAERANKIVAAIGDQSPPVETPSTPPEPVPGEGDQPVTTYNYDNGVVPPWLDYKVSEGAKFAGYIDPADHIIAALFLHSAYGGLEGTTDWYQGGHALTDVMVGNSFDGSKLNGQLRRFNDAYGNRYAWSSGPTKNPIEDAAKFIELFGPDPECINKYTSACERSCAAVVATNPVTEEEHRARCLWIAYHANRYGKYLKAKTGKDLFTCDTFPLIPSQNNRSYLIYHGENNEDKRETCPDPHVRATIDRIIADVRVILSGWQKGTTTIPPQVPPEQMPTYAPVKPINALQAYKDKDAAPAYVKVGKDLFTFVNDRVRATKQTPRYQGANTAGDVIGPPIEKGLEFAVLWLFWDEKETPWYITPYWTRVLVADTERIADAA